MGWVREADMNHEVMGYEVTRDRLITAFVTVNALIALALSHGNPVERGPVVMVAVFASVAVVVAVAALYEGYQRFQGAA